MSLPPLGTKGPNTPSWAEEKLRQFGRTPAGDNIFRVIWSERKLLWIDGEFVQEYDDPQWMLEKWLPPEVFAGSEIMYSVSECAKHLGPYPRAGYYVQVSPQPFVPGVEITPDVLIHLCKLIESGKALTQSERMALLKENQEAKERERRAKLKLAAAEVQTSASQGRTQQAVSGPKNTFRTAEDWERDQGALQQAPEHLPATGLKQF
jgi:hypothetical protein